MKLPTTNILPNLLGLENVEYDKYSHNLEG